MKIVSTHQTIHGNFTIEQPQGISEFEKYFDLRYRILREPWNQPRGSERDSNEDERHHYMLMDAFKNIAGVCCLQQNSETETQIRYMAMDKAYSGKRLGDLLLLASEKKTIELKASRIFLQARSNAVNFYKRNGYTLIEKTFLLFNSIQHYSMEKKFISTVNSGVL